MKILKKLKMKFHQMKTDVVRLTASEIAEIERFVDAVFCFVVVVALIVVSIADASIIALIAVKKTRVSDAVMLMKNLK